MEKNEILYILLYFIDVLWESQELLYVNNYRRVAIFRLSWDMTRETFVLLDLSLLGEGKSHTLCFNWSMPKDTMIPL